MTKGELITILELYKRGRWNLEGVLTAVDAYSSALIAAKPIVSGAVCDNCGKGSPSICDKCYEVESNFRESY